MDNPIFQKVEGGSVFRKIAMGSWSTAYDPSVYGLLELDVTHALDYLRDQEQKNPGLRLTLSHFVGRVIAKVLTERPEINGIIRLSRIYLRKHVDLFYQVNIPGPESDPVGKANLSGVTVRRAEALSVVEIAQILNEKTKALKSGQAGELTRSVNTLAYVPWKLMRWVLNITSFLNYDLRINMTWVGMPRDPFGSVMITNVGSMGVEIAWAPLVPYTRVPFLLTVGTVQPKPWVVEGQVVVRPVVKIGFTFDHRFMDGVHAAAMSEIFKKCFEDPKKHL